MIDRLRIEFKYIKDKFQINGKVLDDLSEVVDICLELADMYQLDNEMHWPFWHGHWDRGLSFRGRFSREQHHPRGRGGRDNQEAAPHFSAGLSNAGHNSFSNCMGGSDFATESSNGSRVPSKGSQPSKLLPALKILLNVISASNTIIYNMITANTKKCTDKLGRLSNLSQQRNMSTVLKKPRSLWSFELSTCKTQWSSIGFSLSTRHHITFNNRLTWWRCLDRWFRCYRALHIKSHCFCHGHLQYNWPFPHQRNLLFCNQTRQCVSSDPSNIGGNN
mgnify:CR=1 FL=1